MTNPATTAPGGLRHTVRRSFDQVRIRVTVTAIAVAIIAAVLGSFLFVSILRENLSQALASSASSQIDTIEAQLENGTSEQDAVVSGQRDIVVQIVRDGRVVASDHRDVTAPVRTTPGTSEDVTVPGVPDTYVVRARRIDSSTLVLVGLSEEQEGRATSVTATLLAVSVPVGLAALGLVMWLSIGRALRPVEEMRTQAEAITSEHLHRRLDVPGGSDEIPRLAHTLNEMLDRIDQSHRLQRQFVSDASHELRSPLAALRQLGEVACRYPDKVTTVDLASDVLSEEQRMEDLVTAMLTLARPDDGGGVRREVDLDDLVLSGAGRLHRSGGPSLDVSGVGAGRVLGDPVLLGQAVRNLLANAERHATSRVVVELGEDERLVTLVVHDDGNGIAPEQREHVFERFVRLDEARARDEGGAGLGLAIVRKVVLGAGGTITVDQGPLGGARFTASFPAVVDAFAESH